MAINITNNTGGGDFKFLTNQSSILHTTDTNDVTINSVNVIVDKPKRGDILCVKDGQVIWIDGLSINPDQLSSEIEPVGICMVINGNKAIVKHLINGEKKQFLISGASLPSVLKTCQKIYFNDDYDNSRRAGGIYFYGAAYDYWGDGVLSWLQPVLLSGGVGVNAFLYPVKKDQFDTNSKCQILRDTYGTYYKYLDSLMIKYPCGNGLVSEIPSGKENTYILANSGVSPAATWVASINVDAPNLGAGNWWIPSVAELVQMTYDITSGTSFWDKHPDIINRVLRKLYRGFPMSHDYPCTSSIYDSTKIYASYFIKNMPIEKYNGSGLIVPTTNLSDEFTVYPITVYEF